MENKIETKTIKAWIQDEIIMLKILIKGEYPIESFKKDIELLHDFIEKATLKKRLLFVDPGQGSSLPLEQRKLLAIETPKFTDKLAILARNPIVSVIASFFLRLNKLPIPVNIFSNKDNAIKWLKKG